MKECTSCQRCFPDETERCAVDNAPLTSTIGVAPLLDSRYQLERRLGQGGMGAVYKARHVFLKTEHAVKVILPHLVGNDPMMVTRFRQEAMAAAAIRHRNIVAVTDFGVVNGTTPYLVMEFIKGQSLHDLIIEKGKLPLERAVEIMEAIAAGVGAAHRRGVVHRDLKPLNIMIRDGVPLDEGVKVLDFGLAKIKSSDLLGSFVVAQTAGIIGSPYYMAPEQWSEEEPDQRADIYSLGVILYQMLAGNVPFSGSSLPAIMRKHLTGQPPSFSIIGVNVPPQVEAALHHAIEKNPDHRPDSLEEFIGELRAAVAQPQVVTYSPPVTADPQALTLVELPSGAGGDRVEESPGGLRDVMEQAVADMQRLEAQPDRAAEAEATREEAARAEAARMAAAQAEAKAQRSREAQAEARAQRRREAQAEAKTQSEAEAQSEAKAQRRREAQAETRAQRRREAEDVRLAAEERARRESTPPAPPAVEPPADGPREAAARVAVEPIKSPPQVGQVPPIPTAGATQQQPAAATDHGNTRLDAFGRVTQQQSAPATNQASTDSDYSASGQQQPPWQMSLSSFYHSANNFVAAQNPSFRLAVGGAVVLFIFLLGAGGASVFVWLRGSSNPASAETSKPDAAKAEMASIPGGTFKMGRSDVSLNNPDDVNQYPAHNVTVSSFYMDKTEVTNAQYAQFVRDTKHATPPHWVNGQPPAGQEQWPVTNVSYDDAQAFAAWRSQRDGVPYRLPTEDEWEYAARNRGTYKLYPWGEQWREGLANVGSDSLKPVGSYAQGAAGGGVLDLIGNAWEWTASKNSIYSGNSAADLADPNAIITRGGAYASKASGEGAITATRRKAAPPDTKHLSLGFRLVRPAS